MTFKSNKNTSNNHLKSNQLLTQKELIDAMNRHTCFTRRFAELLIRQSDPITNQFRKDKQNGR